MTAIVFPSLPYVQGFVQAPEITCKLSCKDSGLVTGEKGDGAVSRKGRQCIDRIAGIQQCRVGVNIHRQIERRVSHRSHGHTRRDARFAEVRAEGVTESVNIYYPATFIVFGDPSGGYVAVKYLDKVARHGEQRNVRRESHRHCLARSYGILLFHTQTLAEIVFQIDHQVAAHAESSPHDRPFRP